MRIKTWLHLLLICALALAIGLVGFAPVAADLFGRFDKDEPTPTPDPWEQEKRDSRLPPATATPTGLTALPSPYGVPMDIVRTLTANRDLLMFSNSMAAADLLETLREEGPFTLFAPTNEAFNKMDSAKHAEMLLPDNRGKLDQMLRYHVVRGRFLMDDLKSTPTLQSINGDTLNIKQTGNTIAINEATITGQDIMVSNGVIHKIDTVLIPPERIQETPMEEQPPRNDRAGADKLSRSGLSSGHAKILKGQNHNPGGV